MGYAPAAMEEIVADDVTLLYVDITWRELELKKVLGDWYDSDCGKGFSPNYNSEELITAYEKTIQAMGDRWGDEELISFIELGGLGHWGEWHVDSTAGVVNCQTNLFVSGMSCLGYQLFRMPIYSCVGRLE